MIRAGRGAAENRAKFIVAKSSEDRAREDAEKRLFRTERRLANTTLKIGERSTADGTLYGSVGARHIVEALAKKQVEVKESQILLDEPIHVRPRPPSTCARQKPLVLRIPRPLARGAGPCSGHLPPAPLAATRGVVGGGEARGGLRGRGQGHGRVDWRGAPPTSAGAECGVASGHALPAYTLAR